MTKAKPRLLTLITRFVIASFVLFACSRGAVASPHDDANAADRRGDHAAELKILEPEAVRGQAWAQNNLGNLYLSGNGVSEDDAQALSWFQKSAAQRDPGGEANLGQLYEHGTGVPKNLARAASLYRAAGEGGRAMGWSLLKRLCDGHAAATPADCARVPAGTKSAPAFDYAAAIGPVFKLLVLSIGLFFSIKRARAALKTMKSRASGDAASRPADGSAVVQTSPLSFVRLILAGSLAVTLLVLAPLVVVIVQHPERSPWSAPMMLWDVAVVGAWAIIVFVRARRHLTLATKPIVQ